MAVRLLALALLASTPARADCRYTPDRASVVCDAGDFGWLMDQTTEAEHARDVARAANERLAGELAARLAQPEPSAVGPVLLAGGAGVLVGLVVGLLVGR